MTLTAICLKVKTTDQYQGRRHREGGGNMAKKGDKGKKERVSKQKLLKECHQGQNTIVLVILERLEFENFSC